MVETKPSQGRATTSPLPDTIECRAQRKETSPTYTASPQAPKLSPLCTMSKPRHFGMDAEIQAMEGKLEFAKNIPLSTNQISPQIPPFRIIFSIKVILAWCCHFLTSFSRRMALSMFSCGSYHTKV